jgi:mannosyltransferase
LTVVDRLRPAVPTAAPRRWHPEQAAVVTLCTAVSAGVVLRHLATKPLWRDEAISLSVAARPITRILSVLPRHDANAGLYYLLLHFWLHISASRAGARGFSAACFIAAAALASWAGGRWRGSETGLACGLLMALNPFGVYYGQETRPYALAVLLATAATVALFWNDSPEGRRPAPRAFLAAAIALVYVDLFALLYLAALLAVAAAIHWRRHQTIPPELKRGAIIIATASAPLALVMGVFERGQISWLPRPNAGALVTTITAMTSGGVGFVLIVALAIVALALAARRDRGLTIALAAAFALPPVTLWTAAQVVPVFIDRYVICSVVAMVALVAAGLTALRDRWGGGGRVAAAAALATLIVLGGQRSAHVEAEAFKVDNAPAVIAFIESHAQPADAVAYAGGGLRILIEASLPRSKADFPADVALAPGGEAFRQHDLYAREVSAPVLATRLETVHRLWLVTDPVDQRYPQGGPFAALRPLVTAAFAPAGTTSFGAVEVTLLTRTG